MPAHGKNVAVLVGTANLSAYFDSASASRSCDATETTCFGSNSKTYTPGLHDGSMSLSGLFDAAAAATDVTLSTALGAATNIVSLLLQGGTTVGGRVKICKSVQTSHDISNAVADKVATAAEIQGDGGVWGGDLLLGLSAVTATGNAAGVDNGVATSDGWVANLHVPAAPGGTVTPTFTYRVQDSADGSAWADLASAAFTAVTAASVQQLVGTGAVRQHTRAAYVVSGTNPTVAAALAFARK